MEPQPLQTDPTELLPFKGPVVPSAILLFQRRLVSCASLSRCAVTVKWFGLCATATRLQQRSHLKAPIWLVTESVHIVFLLWLNLQVFCLSVTKWENINLCYFCKRADLWAKLMLVGPDEPLRFLGKCTSVWQQLSHLLWEQQQVDGCAQTCALMCQWKKCDSKMSVIEKATVFSWRKNEMRQMLWLTGSFLLIWWAEWKSVAVFIKSLGSSLLTSDLEGDTNRCYYSKTHNWKE